MRKSAEGSHSLRLFHLFVLAAFLPLFVAPIIGRLHHYKALYEDLPAATSLILLCSVPGLVWHLFGRVRLRDASLVLPWLAALAVLMPSTVFYSAAFRYPLRDHFFVQIDEALGLHFPAIVQWTANHPLVKVILDRAYLLQSWLLGAAIFLPALSGKKEQAEQFLAANLIAFVASIPLFLWLPGIGPWVGYGFKGTPAQLLCEASISSVRHGGAATFPGLICLPSFHTIWAILSAVALWPNKWLRLPATVLTLLVVISTVTTGWHYAIDPIAGIVVAFGSLACTRWLLNRIAEPFRSQIPVQAAR